nr:hypothetical protein DBT41_10085 [Aerococcus urinae]
MTETSSLARCAGCRNTLPGDGTIIWHEFEPYHPGCAPGAEPRCANCRFFNPFHGGPESDGACHRHAPGAVVDPGGHRAAWPSVGRKRWCGDHEPAQQEANR